MDFKISETNQGEKSLVHDEYVYRIDIVLKSTEISWRCTNRHCKARLSTDSTMCALIPHNMEHSHSSDQRKTERQIL